MTLLVVLAALAAVMFRLQVSHVRRVASERRRLLADVRHVLDDPELAQRGIDYPVLSGRRDGHQVTVAVIVDTVRLRELPVLWLSVTLRQPTPVPGPVDMLLRPSTADIVSPGERFPVERAVPPGWPAHIRVATPVTVAVDLGVLEAALPLLHDPRTKDVLVTPTGVRIVTLLARAELGPYRLVKRAKFDARLTAEELDARVQAARSLVEGLRETARA